VNEFLWWKCFRLFRLEWIVFGVQSVDTVGKCTTSSYLLTGPACVCLRCLDLDGRRFACKNLLKDPFINGWKHLPSVCGIMCFWNNAKDTKLFGVLIYFSLWGFFANVGKLQRKFTSLPCKFSFGSFVTRVFLIRGRRNQRRIFLEYSVGKLYNNLINIPCQK